MKRPAVIFLILIYVISVAGVTIKKHYCEGSLASVSLTFFSHEDACPCGAKKMKKDCCKDVHEKVIVKDVHKADGKTIVVSTPKSSFKFLAMQNLSLRPTVIHNLVTPEYHHRPPEPVPDRCVVNCVFRI